MSEPATAVVPPELRTALHSVNSALTLLRRDPTAAAVGEAVRSATAAVDGLDLSVTTVMLRRMLSSIEDCHRQGVSSSSRLGVRARGTLRALRLEAG